MIIINKEDNASTKPGHKLTDDLVRRLYEFMP